MRALALLVLLAAAPAAESASYAITVVGREDDSTQRIAAMMDEYHQFLSGVFSFTDAGAKLPLRVFRSRDEFKAYGHRVANFRDEWYGFYLYNADKPELVCYFDGAYTGIFLHEGFHQFAHRCFPQIAAWPQWFNEGMAAYLETATYAARTLTTPHGARKDYLDRCRALKAAHQQPALTDFMAIRLADWNRGGDDYAVGASLIAFFMENKDRAVKGAFQKFMSALRQTQDYDKAFATGFAGVDWKRFDERFWSGF